MSSAEVKICGVKSADILQACIDAGVDYVGLVFVSKSPRCVSIDTAAGLVNQAAGQVQTVGLFVDPSFDYLAEVVDRVALDFIQLHGKESPEFCNQVRKLSKRVIKAIAVGSKQDVERAYLYEQKVDMLLFDAKPSSSDGLTGGNAHAFDWHLMKGQSFSVPWMLAGGIDVSNVQEAMKVSGARSVDLSSGVETSRGVKDPDKIRAFVAEAKKHCL